MVAVTERRQTLELPDDWSCLRGGTFEGMEQYVKLMKACCEYEPAQRPDITDVIQELRGLLETAAITKCQKPATPPSKCPHYHTLIHSTFMPRCNTTSCPR